MKPLTNFATTLRTGLRTVLPTCRQVSRLQSEALHQAVSWPDRTGMRLHLLVCKWCRRCRRQLRVLRETARRSPEIRAHAGPGPLPPKVLARLRRAVEEEEASRQGDAHRH